MRVPDELIQEEQAVIERTAGLEIDQLAMSVMANVWRVSQIFRKSLESEVLRDYELTWGSFSTMFIIWVWEPIEMSAIAKSQYVSRPTISSSVSLLEKRGLCKRSPSTSGDGRAVQVELTEQGRTLIEEVFPKFNQGEAKFVDGLDEAEMKMLASLLRKLLRQYEAASAE